MFIIQRVKSSGRHGSYAKLMAFKLTTAGSKRREGDDIRNKEPVKLLQKRNFLLLFNMLSVLWIEVNPYYTTFRSQRFLPNQSGSGNVNTYTACV